MAAILYPQRKDYEERIAALVALEHSLDINAPPKLQCWWGRTPDIEHEPESDEHATSVEPADSPMAKSALRVEAAFRGHLTRKRLLEEAQGDGAGAGASPAPPTGVSMQLIAIAVGAGAGILLLVAALIASETARSFFVGIVGVVFWLLRFVMFDLTLYVLLLVASICAWLRLPRWLGWIGSEALTRFVLFDIPIGFEAVRVVPWVTFSPLTVHADVLVSNFYLGNALHIGCRDPNMVTAKSVILTASCDLSFLTDLIKSGGQLAKPIVVNLPTFIVSDVNFNMMMGATGVFNLYAIATTINEGEIRGSLPKDAPMPNVVRVKVLAARKLLNLPNLKPRITVSVRKTKLSTAHGKEAVDSRDHTTVYHFHGADMVIPTPNSEACLLVRVYNDNVGLGRSPLLIGQWFMTLKWLIQCPTHCKYKEGSLTTTGEGGIAGTFLLTDAKLQGSAVRGRGPHDLGNGFSGELDMAIQWTHTNMLDPPPASWTMCNSPHAGNRPMSAPIGATGQLGSTGDDDGLRFGNWAEFKDYLHGAPIRITTDHFVLRKA